MIKKNNLRIFSTSDLMTLTGMNPDSLTHALRRMEAQELIAKVRRGLWANSLISDFHPYETVGHIMAPWPAYISLYSALAEYGKIEEIPHIIYAVSPARRKKCKTPIGNFHIHHLPPDMIWGYSLRKTGQGSYLIAEPEKAFLDLIYLSLIPRSPIVTPYKRDKLWKFNRHTLRKYSSRFKFRPLTDFLVKNGLI
ncbi:hypothetical protein ACFL6Y_07780 [Elusimicrobiota bacterium]